MVSARRERLPSATYHSSGDESWTRDIYADQMIAVHAQQHPAADIARHVAEKKLSSAPFFVMDVPSVLKAIDLWQANMNRFTTRYALRCNSDPVLAQLLVETQGMGFEVQNDYEMEMAISLVADPSMVIYNNPLWRQKNMKRAGEAGVGTVVVSSENELFNATRFAEYSKILIAVSIPGCHVRQEAFGVNQGCSLEVAEDLLKMAYDTCANFDGFAFNIDNRDPSAYFKAFKYIKDLWTVAVDCGLSPKTISVGGGFRFQEKVHFQEVTRDLHEAAERFFPLEEFPFLKLIATPGRFFATPAFSLCTNVIGKQRVDVDETPFYRYFTNEGVYGVFGCRLADVELKCTPLKENIHNEAEAYGSVIGELEAKQHLQVFLSRQLAVGEWLFWENMGAYSMYPDEECPPVYYFTGKDNWERINKRRFSHQQLETISDVGSDAASDVVTDDEDDSLAFDALFTY